MTEWETVSGEGATSKSAPNTSKWLDEEPMVPTPHQREGDAIAASLAQAGYEEQRADELAAALQSLGGRKTYDLLRLSPILLAAALTIKQLEAAQIAVARAPRSEYRGRIDYGHHSRQACLARPDEWCHAIGDHPGVCDSCPSRNVQLGSLERVLTAAADLRRAWDEAMWRWR